MDGRADSIDKKLAKIDAELIKYKEQLKKMNEGAAKVRARALRDHLDSQMFHSFESELV